MTMRDVILGIMPPAVREPTPRVSASGNTMTVLDLKDPALADLLRGGAMTDSGVAITPDHAMKVGVAFRCSKVRTGIVATMPWDLYRRVDERRRKPAIDHPMRNVLTVKPNRWQTPSEFRRLLEMHLLNAGNGYAYKRVLGGEVRELIPLDAWRMRPKQNDDLSITYEYTKRNGVQQSFAQTDILHLRGMSLDGITGLSVIGQARQALGLSIQSEKVNAKLFKNGQFRSLYFETDQALGDAAYERLKSDLEAKKGADADDVFGGTILEEGLKVSKDSSISAEDLQFLGLRQYTRTDVGMFYGVPPFIYGDTEKSTSWGTGIGQQNIAFLQYTVQDDLTTWEDALKRDCLSGLGDEALYVKFDTKGFLRMDATERREWNKAALGNTQQQGWECLNEVRAVEELDPIEEDWANQIPRVVQQPKPNGTEDVTQKTA